MIPMRDHFSLEAGVHFLNHGSFGATPLKVQAVQREFQARLEAEPVRFLMTELEPLLDAARGKLAAFVGARPQDLVFVTNATEGVNTVLRSLKFEPGDELLTTSHAYNACANALHFVAAQWGARVVVAEVPFPLESAEQVTRAVLAKVSGRTKLALIDHVTSPTAVRFPVETLVPALEAQGVRTLVDGAHAPGMLPLELTALGASFYTANLHKWVCAPKGAAFLHVREDLQPLVHPLSISHGYNAVRSDKSHFHTEFDWTGTRDFSPWLSVPAAIDFMGALLPGGWPALRAHNHQLAVEARLVLTTALGLAPPCPDALLGSMAALILPGAAQVQGSLPGAGASDPLKEHLYAQHRIQLALFTFQQHRVLRVTAQIYNSISEYQQLAGLLKAAL